MSRPLRCNLPGVLYHVTSRGNSRQEIVRSDDDRREFVARLGRVITARRWVLHSWVLMTNHLHLLLETPLANLSAGMRDLLGGYASYFNTRHGRVGHLFQHRFFALIVERENHLLELARYVPLNPVRCGLVARPEEWPWSSYRAMAGHEPAPPWLDIDATLAQFAPDRCEAQATFRAFVAEGRGMPSPCREAAGGWIVGSLEFRDRVQSWIDSEERSREIPRRQRRITAPALESVVSLVRRELSVTDAELRPRSRSHARKLVAELGHVECGLSYGALAESLGSNAWAVAKLRSKSLQMERSDAAYAATLRRLRQSLAMDLK